MKPISRLRSWLRATFQRARLEREMEDELRFHIAAYSEDLCRKGVPREEAERRAKAEFGGLDCAKEQCRSSVGAGVLESFLFDLGYGFRILRKNPGFAFVAIMTLGVGIGATTAVFSAVNAILLRDLPYRQSERLVFVWEPNPNIPGVPLQAWGPFNGDFYDWQKESHSFTHLALFTTESLNLSLTETAVRVTGSRVTGDFFQVLGVSPVLGRSLQAEDDQPGKIPIAVISHALWQSQFGSDPHVLGREFMLNARSYRVIGVMPAGFAFPHGSESIETSGKTTDVWVPWGMTAKERASREDDPGTAIGRLRPGVTPNQAQAELSAITARLNSLHLPMLQNSRAVVQPFKIAITASSSRALLTFMAAVFLVLLIASSNVAGLILARASARAQEVNVRAALGASRSRLIRQLLTESFCLSVGGGILGVLSAYAGVRILTRLSPGSIPRFNEISIDTRVLLFAMSISIGTGILFGLFPALSVSRGNLNDALKGSGGRTVKRSGSVLHRALMLGEVALTIVLLAASGLLIRSFVRLESVDKGFGPSSTVTMNIHLDERYSRPEQRNNFFRALIERASTLPGIQAAGAINHLPLGGGESIGLLVVEGHPFDEKTFFEERSVTPLYFSAMGIPLLEGRFFGEDEISGSPRVAIVSRNFARKYFPGASAIGKHVSVRDEARGGTSAIPWTIVGVVADVRQVDLESTPPMQVYTPLWQGGASGVSVVARTSLSATQLASDMRAIVRNLDSAVAIADVHTMSEWVSTAEARRRFETVILTAFGGIALFLSLVGLYGLMAYSVQQRTAEIGIRMALGAQRSNVMRMILKETSALAIIGIALGSVCALAVTRLMASLLYQVRPTDPATFFVVAILFLATALGACCVPALRAMRVQPVVALRYE